MAFPRNDKSSPSDAARMAWLMGLPKWQDVDDLAMAEKVKTGLPAVAAEKIALRIDPTGQFLLPTDIVPKSTLHRRQSEKPHRLSKAESERVFVLSKLLLEVQRVFASDSALTVRFLITPHPMLGGKAPLLAAKESAAGAELVMKLLAKADAGIAI